jgi:hypothetical protein
LSLKDSAPSAAAKPATKVSKKESSSDEEDDDDSSEESSDDDESTPMKKVCFFKLSFSIMSIIVMMLKLIVHLFWLGTNSSFDAQGGTSAGTVTSHSVMKSVQNEVFY